MNKYTYDSSTLQQENDVSYYILGAFISDGNVSIQRQKYYTSSIGSVDKDWIEDIRKAMSLSLPIKQQDNFFSLRIYDANIGKWFISHGCIPRKSLCVSMPHIPNKYLADFVRGVFDGDGCVSYTIKTNKTINFKSYICGSSIELLSDLQQKLSTIGIVGALRLKKQNKTHKIKGKTVHTFNDHWRLEFSKLNTLKLLEFMYYEGHKISLKRKFETFKTIKNIYSKDKKINYMLNTHLKIKWPSNEELIKLVQSNTYMAVSRLLGVSNTSIVSYMKNRGIYVPKIKGGGKKNITLSRS